MKQNFHRIEPPHPLQDKKNQPPELSFWAYDPGRWGVAFNPAHRLCEIATLKSAQRFAAPATHRKIKNPSADPLKKYSSNVALWRFTFLFFYAYLSQTNKNSGGL